jgi:adenosine deaminase
MHKFISQLPKAELHNHLDGSLRIDTIIDIARKTHIKLPSFDKDELARLLINDENCQSLKEYFIPFEISLSVLQTAEALEQTTFELLEDVAKENVKYLEIRFCPLLHMGQSLKLNQIIESVLSGKKQAEKEFGIKSGIIVSGLRQNTPNQNLELAKLAVQYKNKGVVAFDLAGDELGFPALIHQKAFDYAYTHHLNRTVHAGEADGAHSIRDAIFGLKAQRIGHGTHLFQDADLLKYVRDKQIPLEVCLSSNLQTKAVDSLENHPIKDYFKQGIKLTLNTDSYLISDTSLSKEMELAVKYFQFSKDELQEINLNAFQSAFLAEDEKQDLIRNVKIDMQGLFGSHK